MLSSICFLCSSRRIANPFLGLALIPALVSAADLRVSAPGLGWLLSPDGRQVIAITGVPESPRAGDAIPLPGLARQLWSAPDASAALIRLDEGLYLLRPGLDPAELAAVSADAAVSAAWDRASAGFAACWADSCRAFDRAGLPGAETAAAPGVRLLAYSASAGLLTVEGDAALWRAGGSTRPLDAVPAAAAFLPGASELWFLDPAGRLAALSAQGARRDLPETVDSPIALVASADGQSVFVVNATGEAAVLGVASGAVTRHTLEETVEGAWPAPGNFNVRLHESAKRPLAIFNGETGLAGWAPAAAREVEQ